MLLAQISFNIYHNLNILCIWNSKRALCAATNNK